MVSVGVSKLGRMVWNSLNVIGARVKINDEYCREVFLTQN